MSVKRKNSQQQNKKTNLKKINYNVSGIDLGSKEMFAAIVDKGVRRVTTFTNIKVFEKMENLGIITSQKIGRESIYINEKLKC